jgi:predicted MFS family arabinose efflux permease
VVGRDRAASRHDLTNQPTTAQPRTRSGRAGTRPADEPRLATISTTERPTPTITTSTSADQGSVGFVASLPLQERLLTHTKTSQRGQVLGLNSTGLMVMQGVGAILGGALAQLLSHGTTGVAWTMATLAVLSLAITCSLSLNRPRFDAASF